jgi:hypothetical protein
MTRKMAQVKKETKTKLMPMYTLRTLILKQMTRIPQMLTTEEVINILRRPMKLERRLIISRPSEAKVKIIIA